MKTVGQSHRHGPRRRPSRGRAVRRRAGRLTPVLGLFRRHDPPRPAGVPEGARRYRGERTAGRFLSPRPETELLPRRGTARGQRPPARVAADGFAVVRKQTADFVAGREPRLSGQGALRTALHSRRSGHARHTEQCPRSLSDVRQNKSTFRPDHDDRRDWRRHRRKRGRRSRNGLAPGRHQTSPTSTCRACRRMRPRCGPDPPLRRPWCRAGSRDHAIRFATTRCGWESRARRRPRDAALSRLRQETG